VKLSEGLIRERPTEALGTSRRTCNLATNRLLLWPNFTTIQSLVTVASSSLLYRTLHMELFEEGFGALCVEQSLTGETATAHRGHVYAARHQVEKKDSRSLDDHWMAEIRFVYWLGQFGSEPLNGDWRR
jgi:hypothetical protein